jgi:hypothetical protein
VRHKAHLQEPLTLPCCHSQYESSLLILKFAYSDYRFSTAHGTFTAQPIKVAYISRNSIY